MGNEVKCYDWAAATAGKRKGVATQMKLLNYKLLYLHCFGHALNLQGLM